MQRERELESPTFVPNGPGLTDLQADLDLDLRERPLLLKCVGLQLRPTERDAESKSITCHCVGSVAKRERGRRRVAHLCSQWTRAD
jgi:hypothetical protein